MTIRIDTITPTMQQLLWLNQNSQSPVVATIERAGDGTPIVEQSVIPSGLPIILGTKNSGITRADFEALQAHNASTLTPFELEYEGNTWQVIWDNSNGDAITGDDQFDQIGGYYMLTNVQLKFLTAA